MTNNQAQMSNQAQNSKDKKKYDLEERTAQFGEAIIEFVKTLPKDLINKLWREAQELTLIFSAILLPKKK